MVTVDYNVKMRDIEPLVEGHWPALSREMKFSFLEAGITHYLDGSNAPNEYDKKSVQTEWKIINSHIIGTLGRHIAPALAEELREDMSATEAWSLLKKRTQQDGIFANLNAMHVTIPIKFSHNTLTIDTLSELKNLLACIYKGGQAPTQEEWSIVLCSMHLRAQITTLSVDI